MRLVLATRNPGKVAELAAILGPLGVAVESLADAPGRPPEVEEDGESFVENARKKALAIARWSGRPALADDSGLAVDALGGRPGVRSSRFAGEEGNSAANNALLLRLLESVPDGGRGAHFVCVLCLAAPDGRTWEAEGRVDGVIAREERGTGGFGYDPLFLYSPAGLTFAEMDAASKNLISHRRRALDRLAALLPEILRQVQT